MVTRRCNMECAHCSVESSSRIRQQPSETDLHSIITQAADAGVGAILFTGGEPMLREPVVRRLIAAATRCSLATLITTNGFWGKTLPQARRTLKSLRKAGLGFITLSYDRYHAEFQGPQPGKNILRAAEELEVPMNINVTRVANDTDLASLLAPFEGSSHARVATTMCNLLGVLAAWHRIP
jgi:MoaA/NifB/PqqE/SkfB family radical SAM enzyme